VTAQHLGREHARTLRQLFQHHEKIAERIVGALTVDVEALTDNQSLAEAREFYHHYTAGG